MKKINQDVAFVKNDIGKVNRSIFNRVKNHKCDFDSGKLIPFFLDEVIPGDTFNLKVASLLRLLSPQIKPVMDDLEMNFGAFFVPMRLVEKDGEKIIANYKDDPDGSTDVNEICSQLHITGNGFTKYSLGDYFGLPVGIPGSDCNTPINALPFRAYAMIWNHGFRDENFQKSIPVSTDNCGNYISTNISDSNFLNTVVYGGALAPLFKKKDYFTSALPAPQKGSAVEIGLGAGNIPVVNGDDENIDLNETGVNQHGLKLYAQGRDGASTQFEDLPYTGENAGDLGGMHPNVGGDPILQTFNKSGGSMYRYNQFFFGEDQYLPEPDLTKIKPYLWGSTHGAKPGYAQKFGTGMARTPETEFDNVVFHNLMVDLNQVTGISINDLRYAFQIQMIKEADARNGNRYVEYLLSHYGVKSADARLQIPEFLGSIKYNVNSTQVVQNSATTTGSPQANLSSFSQTGNVSHLFSKSFTEHGYVIVVGGVRLKSKTYSQGINKLGSHLARFDFYHPELAHIGEQPIKNKEIFLTGQSAFLHENEQIFGYQEAGSEYRYLPNTCSGSMRPYVTENLGVGNYAENYSQLPTLSANFLKEDKSNIDRTLALSSEVVKQFIIDIQFINKCVRPLPVHSVPGLIDHNGHLIL